MVSDDHEVRPDDVQAALLDGPLDGQQLKFDYSIVRLCVFEET